QKSPKAQELIELKSEVHKLAGSSGSYGFTEVSRLCKALELELADQIELAHHSIPSASLLASLDDFFSKIQFLFQLVVESQQQIVAILLSCTLQPPLYLLDLDFYSFLFSSNRIKKDIVMVVEEDPAEAISFLISAT